MPAPEFAFILHREAAHPRRRDGHRTNAPAPASVVPPGGPGRDGRDRPPAPGGPEGRGRPGTAALRPAPVRSVPRPPVGLRVPPLVVDARAGAGGGPAAPQPVRGMVRAAGVARRRAATDGSGVRPGPGLLRGGDAPAVALGRADVRAGGLQGLVLL